METSNKEIKDLVDNGFIKLLAWLEKRFQQNEDLIRKAVPGAAKLSHTTQPADFDGGNTKWIVDHHRGSVKVPMVERTESSDSPQPWCSDQDSLRMAARIMRSNSIQRHVLPQYGMPPSGEELMSLPGSMSDNSPLDIVPPSQAWEPEVVSPAEPVKPARSSAETTVQAMESQSGQPQGIEARRPKDYLKPLEKDKNNWGMDKVGQPITPEQDWQSKFMDVFDQLDVKRCECIDRQQVAQAFSDAGPPPVRAFEQLASEHRQSRGAMSPKSGDGSCGGSRDSSVKRVMDRDEWLHMIEVAEKCSTDSMDLLKFVDRLKGMQKTKGNAQSNDSHASPKSFMILRHDSPFRVIWDILMMIFLFYISLGLPYSLGFGPPQTIQDIDAVLDFFFCFDILLNFRTSYVDRHDAVVMDAKTIGLRYAKSWFTLDFMSSVPFDLLTAGIMPSFQPARLLKMGKIAKVMKLLKMKEMLRRCEGSELMEKVEEKSASKLSETMMRLVQLMFLNLVLAHWLACFGASVDSSHLDAYFEGLGVEPTKPQMYLAAVYWAMTTLSTVGYGDILPTTDVERVYSMFAMVVGGAFYGYIIGSVTSIVSDMDLNARAVTKRMDLVQCWLDCHLDIPKALRRRVRKSYKMTLSEQSALEDSSILKELSPELRAEMAGNIIHEHVRSNPMFCGISDRALANLVMILQSNYAQGNEFIVKVGNPGVAMYILVDGCARYDRGVIWRPAGVQIESRKFQKLREGDSFGEEIIFGLEEDYNYTIMAISACQFHSISEDGFIDQFRSMPSVHRFMYHNVLQLRSTAPFKEAIVLKDFNEHSDVKQFGMSDS